MSSVDVVTLLGVKVDRITSREAYLRIEHWLLAHEGPRYVVTPNPEICVHASRDARFKAIVNAADLRLPDGIGIVLAARMRGVRLRQRVSGADLLPQILEACERNGLKVACVIPARGLSSKSDVESMIHMRFPALKAVVTHKGDAHNLRDLNAAECIVVALGAPHQEEWIVRNMQNLHNARVLMAVGTALDFLTGRAARAPSLFRKTGLEWLWRLLYSLFERGDDVVPHKFWRRLKRIWTAVIIFPWLIIRERTQ